MMNKRILIQMLMLIILFSCKKDNEFDFALIQTGDVTDIDTTGATFHARISDLSNSNIVKYGFVWSTESNPEIQNSEKYLISGEPSVGTISEKISTTLKDSVTYYVRAFMQNDNYITYGKEVTFTSLGSLAPDISGFTFKSGTNIDTIIICGHNFSYLDNTVHFNETKGNVLKATQDSLITILPDTIYHNLEKISVTVSGNKTEYSTIFNNLSESSFTLSEKIETFGSYITITSNEINYTKGSLRVLFNNIISKTIYLDNKNIRVQIPENLNKRTPNIIVISERNRSVIHNQFSLAALEILDFSPTTILTGEKIILTGNNFSPIPENNIIQIGGIPAEVVNASLNELEVVVPMQDKGIYPERNVNISLEVLDENQVFSDTLIINDKWFRRTDCPFGSYGNHNVVVINNNAYIGLNGTQTFYIYSPENNEWSQLASFPGAMRYDGVSIAINNKLYFGTGSKGHNFNDFWEFSPSSNTWIEKTEFPGEERTRATGFTIQEFGYIGTGYSSNELKDFYKYNPISDEWNEIEPVPTETYHGIHRAVAVTIQNEGYIGLGALGIQGNINNRLWKYNPSYSSWERIDDFPIHSQYGHWDAIAFSFGNNGFFKSDEYPDKLWKYNSSINSWLEECDIPSFLENSRTCFSIRSIAFFINENNQMWEYDSNRQ